MNIPWRKLKEKLTEAMQAVLPIIGIVLVLCFSIAPISPSILLCFLLGAVMIIVGIMFFTLGAETSMTPMGSRTGAEITRSRKLWLVILMGFILGFIITISEPDLQVLAQQVPSIPNRTLIYAVAAGVGLFLVVALLRMLLGIPLPHLLLGFYAVVFALTLFVPKSFLAVAFDSGGVTTGPMTVPFIMALGVGVCAIRSDRHAASDSFGLVALCSIGPILAVMILGMVYKPSSADYIPPVLPEVVDSVALWSLFRRELPAYLKEIAVSLAPIVAFFGLLQAVSLKMPWRNLRKIVVGLVYTYVGLVLFLTGANVGFMPAGNYLGQKMAQLPYNWIIVPIGMLIGYFIVKAEPAVYVLNKQVEEITDGAISASAMGAALSIGVGVSVGAGHAAGADRDLYPVAHRAGLRHRAGAFLRGAQDLYGHRLRLRRRGLRPHDGHLPSALCPGGLRGRGRKYRDRRLWRGGHGGHDAADHHPGPGPGVSAQEQGAEAGADAGGELCSAGGGCHH